MIRVIEKYPQLTIVLIVLLMLLVHLDIPNVTIMEARNFISAREMINDDHWLLTTMNGEARYQKPPLPTWLTAISSMAFGLNSLFALRLPAVLMICFLGLFLYKITIKLNLPQIHSLYAGLILITSFYIIGIINEAPWDIYAHGFMLAGIYYVFQILRTNSTNWKYVYLAGFFIACSIMSKGPIAIYALLLPFLIAYGIVFKFQKTRKKAFPLFITILIFLILGSSWYLYIRIADPETFLAIATKETSNWSSYNVKPFYYYWSFFTQSGIWTIPALIGLMYPYMIKRVTDKKVYAFSFWWTISAVILLSIIPEKKARYLVPVLIPLAINTSFYISYLINSFKIGMKKTEKAVVYFNFILIALIAFVLPIGVYFLIEGAFEHYFWSFLCVSIASLTIGVLLIKGLSSKNLKLVFYCTISFMVAIPLFGLPLTKGLNKNTHFHSINTLHIIEEELDIKTFSIGDLTPELVWDYDGIIPNIYKSNSFQTPVHQQFGLLIMNSDVDEILALLKKDFKSELKATYNLNVGSKTKERLIRQFYLISKK